MSRGGQPGKANEVDSALAVALRDLAQHYDLIAIYAFGSRAKEIAGLMRSEAAANQHEAGSDVDIGVLPASSRRLTARDRVRLALALEVLLAVRRVDPVVAPEASAFLARDIVAGELLYTSDQFLEAEFQLYALRRAGDLAPFEREAQREWLTGEDGAP